MNLLEFSVFAFAFGKCSTDFETEVFEAGFFAHDSGFTARLTLCLVLRAGHVDDNMDFDFRMQINRHGVQAEGLDRGVEADLLVCMWWSLCEEQRMHSLNSEDTQALEGIQ